MPKLQKYVLAACALMTTMAATSAAVPDASAAEACHTFEFVGVAGSGELSSGSDQRKTLWMGATVKDLYDKVARRYKSSYSTVKPYGVRYAAIPFDRWFPHLDVYEKSYKQSVRQGVDNLSNHLKAEARRCPAQQFIVSGYSQGAQVALKTFDEVGAELQGRIRSMLLFGDPTYNPRNTAEAVGRPTAGKRSGIYSTRFGVPGTVHPVDVQRRVRSYCDARDPVCQFGPPFKIAPHLEYRDWATTRAANFLLGLEPPAKCPVSTAVWSASGPASTSAGVEITSVEYLKARAAPGYRLVGFVGVAAKVFAEGPDGAYVSRLARIDQPSYEFPGLNRHDPDQRLLAAGEGRAYYLQARAVPERCGESTRLTLNVPVAQSRHIVLKGSLTAGNTGVAGYPLEWYRQKVDVPGASLFPDGINFDNVTDARGIWKAEYRGRVKELLSAGRYRMALAFAGDVNHLPALSPLVSVRVSETP